MADKNTGRPLVNHNGVVTDMTDTEYARYLSNREKYENRPKPQPTEAQRIAELEARLAAYENAYKEGVQNA